MGHQNEPPDAQRAGGQLLNGQDLAETQAGKAAEGQGSLVVECEGQVRMLHQDVVTKKRGVAQMLQDRHINLAVLLQPGMAGKLKKGQEREPCHSDNSGCGHRKMLHFAGVLSSCCFTQIRLGFSSSDLPKAWRASAFLFSLRKLRPSRR